MSKPMWARQRKGRQAMPHWETLRRWRTEARRAAKAAGCKTSCDLCKRMIKAEEMAAGAVWLTPPQGAPTMKRRVCSACYTELRSVVDVMEAESKRWHLQPEERDE